jgi:hypothetical protein
MYGGSAELAVISITTKGAEQNGGRVSVRPEFASGQAGTAVSGSVGYTFRDWRASVGIDYERFDSFEGPWVSSEETASISRAGRARRPRW